MVISDDPTPQNAPTIGGGGVEVVGVRDKFGKVCENGLKLTVGPQGEAGELGVFDSQLMSNRKVVLLRKEKEGTLDERKENVGIDCAGQKTERGRKVHIGYSLQTLVSGKVLAEKTFEGKKKQSKKCR